MSSLKIRHFEAFERKWFNPRVFNLQKKNRFSTITVRPVRVSAYTRVGLNTSIYGMLSLIESCIGKAIKWLVDRYSCY